MENICAIVLAAGKGTRMGKGAPKMLRKLLGKPLIFWTLDLIENLGLLKKTIVVIGYKAVLVERTIKKMGFNPIFVRQDEQLGTAHSLQTGLVKVPKNTEHVLVLFSDDAVLYKTETIREFINDHITHGNNATLLTHKTEGKLDIGGLKRDKRNEIVGVLTRQQLLENRDRKSEVLCGGFCFKKDWIEKMLPQIKPSSVSGEYPLPGIISVAISNKQLVNSFNLENKDEWTSINSPVELSEAEDKKRKLLNL